jgi:hypothetical protein
VNFQVQVDGSPQLVEVVFGGETDVAQIGRWRSPPALRDNPHVRDALEFSRLASKRWRYYKRTNAAATSRAQLQAAIRRSPRAEVAFMLLARGTWPMRQPILGLCHCRRTWAHSIVVDFAASHPNVIGSVRHRIRGVGTGMFFNLLLLANELGIETLWGEATENSAPFYTRILGYEVRDNFFIHGASLEHCRAQYRAMHGLQA